MGPRAFREGRRGRSFRFLKIGLWLGVVYLVATTVFGFGGSGDELSEGILGYGEVQDEGGSGQHRRLAGLAHVLFGAADYQRPFIGAVSLLIVVFCVIATEGFFEGMNHLAHDTPFEELITAIENEMMIVGFMAFVLKVILNLTYINADWLLALEYSDLLVPIITFLRCFIGVGFIYMSIQMCDFWMKAYHSHHLVVMEMFIDRSHKFWARGRFSWIPISWDNSMMEFRIFHHIFCETFMIQRKAFAFDEYVHRIFEKFLLRIIGMHEIDWFLICALALLNWLRLEYRLDIHACFADKSEPNYCKTVYSDCDCHKLASFENFIIFGFAVLAFTIFLAVISRVYELRLLMKRGVHTSDDYALYLEAAEKEAQHQDGKEDKKRFSADALKLAVARAKEKAEMEKAKHENSIWYLVEVAQEHVVHFFRWLTCSKHQAPTLNDNYSSKKKLSDKGSNKKGLGRIVVEEFDHVSDDEERPSTSPTQTQTQTKTDTSTSAAPPQSSPPPGASALHSIGRSSKGHSFETMASNLNNRDTSAALDRLDRNLDGIFMFSKPNLYFEAVQLTMMPVSFYLALWVTNFVSLATEMYNDSHDKVYWQLVSLCPGFFSVFFYAYSVRVASLLLAVTQIDHDAVEEILEQTESAKFLREEMREKIVARLEEIGDPRKELQELFKAIDDNGSGLLSRSEFQLFLNELQITFSRRKWAQIYAEIDRDNSDEIDYDELFFFIFPDSHEAQRMERRRIRDIEKRVGRKADVLLQKQSERRKSFDGTPAGGVAAMWESMKGSFNSTGHANANVLSGLAASGKKGTMATNLPANSASGSGSYDENDSAPNTPLGSPAVRVKPGGGPGGPYVPAVLEEGEGDLVMSRKREASGDEWNAASRR